MWALIMKLNKGNSLREITILSLLTDSPIKKEMNNNALSPPPQRNIYVGRMLQLSWSHCSSEQHETCHRQTREFYLLPFGLVLIFPNCLLGLLDY